jgi:SAM-dependent methyltransferase
MEIKAIDSLHERFVLPKRAQKLAGIMAGLIPHNASVLDVGCGDGQIAAFIAQSRPDLQIHGVDVIVRKKTYIQVEKFDGITLPFADGSYDVAMFVDVLHHTDDPMIMLREAQRVARQAIVIKDHTADGFMAKPTLRFMDWVGNARYRIAMPYNYWPQARWEKAFDALGLSVDLWETHLKLFPVPAHWLFDRRLHFVTRLAPRGT